MIIFLTIFLSLLLIAGGLIQLSSFSKYSTYVSTEGEIIAFTEHIGGKGQAGNKQWFKEAMPVSYLPVIAYRVGEAIYELELSQEAAWKRPDFRKRMELVYNPYEPRESYVKEGTPYLGLLLIGSSALGLLGLLIF